MGSRIDLSCASCACRGHVLDERKPCAPFGCQAASQSVRAAPVVAAFGRQSRISENGGPFAHAAEADPAAFGARCS